MVAPIPAEPASGTEDGKEEEATRIEILFEAHVVCRDKDRGKNEGIGK